MEEYKPNSRRSKEQQAAPAPERRLEKVVTGAVKPKKKNEIQKFADVFISEDAANVKSYILQDVIIPATKRILDDVIVGSLRMFLYGESERGRKGSTASKISYRSFYEKDSDRHRSYSSQQVKTGFDYDNIVFATRGDAESVLTEMENVIEQFGFVSVGDLYDLADISTDNYAVHRYGWTNLSSAKTVPTRDGYMIKLPRAVALN